MTSLSHKGGCGYKIGPAALMQVLRQLPQNEPHPNLSVGLETRDDVGVYQLNDEIALVQTVDFFTPIGVGISTTALKNGLLTEAEGLLKQQIYPLSACTYSAIVLLIVITYKNDRFYILVKWLAHVLQQE